MGTSIELKFGEISLDYFKNGLGNDHGFLFQKDDLTRRHSDEIDYEYFKENPNDQELSLNEACFARPLRRILPRLDLLGQTIEVAKNEYDSLVEQEAHYYYLTHDADNFQPKTFLSFDDFCALCNDIDISQLDGRFIGSSKAENEFIETPQFAAIARDLNRVPNNSARDTYWSEKDFFGNRMCILSPYSMLQVLGRSKANLDTEVVWQFGPIVEAGWVARDIFQGGADRRHSILIATEGTSDARILRRAIDVLRPDITDFFNFIDVEQSHPFPGTGNLVKFAEGLVRINIQNRILFVLDNDAEGLAGFKKIMMMHKPANMRAMILPHLEEFKNFLARGPEGLNHSNINQRAAAIECYLDLRLPNRPEAEVVWSNYKREIDRWHGALDHKETYTRHFFEHTDEQLRDGSYNVHKIEMVLDNIVKEATELAISDA